MVFLFLFLVDLVDDGESEEEDVRSVTSNSTEMLCKTS